ncbi:transcription factor with AP2 domain(s) [Reticulomyxa filosa]|uniref:Transcription factor with AP2 domain(S) n=1 Tax=Reticulomyxa filosa TaxID=46433 RepID=X6LDP4_RETFI|nr:transcription factor with AP2 domain(s) [Reticulomyxa filosa]|eukprot:ETN99251.1 transcription factor with AP2 domain(s) [Reticulomyxa filosa]
MLQRQAERKRLLQEKELAKLKGITNDNSQTNEGKPFQMQGSVFITLSQNGKQGNINMNNTNNNMNGTTTTLIIQNGSSSRKNGANYNNVQQGNNPSKSKLLALFNEVEQNERNQANGKKKRKANNNNATDSDNDDDNENDDDDNDDDDDDDGDEDEDDDEDEDEDEDDDYSNDTDEEKEKLINGIETNETFKKRRKINKKLLHSKSVGKNGNGTPDSEARAEKMRRQREQLKKLYNLYKKQYQEKTKKESESARKRKQTLMNIELPPKPLESEVVFTEECQQLLKAIGRSICNDSRFTGYSHSFFFFFFFLK